MAIINPPIRGFEITNSVKILKQYADLLQALLGKIIIILAVFSFLTNMIQLYDLCTPYPYPKVDFFYSHR